MSIILIDKIYGKIWAIFNNSLYVSSIGVTARNWEGKPITIITIEAAKPEY